MGSGSLRTGVCCAAALWGAVLAAAPATAPLADDDTPGVRNAHALAYDGRVVDFLNVGIDSLRTGIFNVADMAITFGALLMLLESLRASKSPVVSAE